MDAASCASELRRIAGARAIDEGRELHRRMRAAGMDRITYLANHLVKMYGRCGSVAEARAVFDAMRARNVFSWNLIIAACVPSQEFATALDLFHRMEREGTAPDLFTFATVLGACSDLDEGKLVHEKIAASQIEHDLVLENSLLGMYSRCGSVAEARRIFDQMLERDLVTWNTMISANARAGHAAEALALMPLMDLEGIKFDDLTLVALLGCCASLGSIEVGRALRSRARETGLDRREGVKNAILNMLAKCGDLESARQLFRELGSSRDAVSWTCLLAGYVQCGLSSQALEIFEEMVSSEVGLDAFAVATALSACSSSDLAARGRAIHDRIRGSLVEADLVVGTALINMYSRCGSLADAQAVFAAMADQTKDVVAWNAIVSANERDGHSSQALDLYRRMLLEGTKPNSASFVSASSACCSIDQTREIEEHASWAGFERSEPVSCALVDAYASLGSIENAEAAFRRSWASLVAFTSMVGAYARLGHRGDAMALFHRMSLEGMRIDELGFVAALGACSTLAEGMLVSRQIEDRGLEGEAIVGTAAVEMFSRMGQLDLAERWFSRIDRRDVVAWNAMLAAYASRGDFERALDHYRKMDVIPNAATFVGLLLGGEHRCSKSQVEIVHGFVRDHGLEQNTMVMTSLLNAYSQAGSLDFAVTIFAGLASKSLATWNSMVAAFARHGDVVSAIQTFLEMNLEGTMVDYRTLTTILHACSHTGLVSPGIELIGFAAQDLHYNHGNDDENREVFLSALIDLLGRAGWLQDSEALLQEMEQHSQSESVAWRSLLSSCRIHRDNGVGTRAARTVLGMEPRKSADYLLVTTLADLADG